MKDLSVRQGNISYLISCLTFDNNLNIEFVLLAVRTKSKVPKSQTFPFIF